MDINTMDALHRHMRELREDHDMSQTDVAKYLGVGQTTYSQYELDQRKIPVEYVVALCKLYKVSADYMLGLSDQK